MHVCINAFFSVYATQPADEASKLEANAHLAHRFDSFAPLRTGISAQWFVDGKYVVSVGIEMLIISRDTYEAIAEAINSAREEIFITDWYVTCQVAPIYG